MLGKLLQLGLKQHPESAVLNFHAGMLAVAESMPPFIGSAAKKHLEKALKLAEASTVPAETALLPTIKSALTMINEIGSGPGGLPFGGGPFGFPFHDVDPFEFINDFDLGDDCFGDEFEPAPRSMPRPKPKKKNQQKKR